MDDGYCWWLGLISHYINLILWKELHFGGSLHSLNKYSPSLSILTRYSGSGLLDNVAEFMVAEGVCILPYYFQSSQILRPNAGDPCSSYFFNPMAYFIYDLAIM